MFKKKQQQQQQLECTPRVQTLAKTGHKNFLPPEH